MDGNGRSSAGSRRFLITMAVDRYPNLDGPAGDLVWPGRDAERVRELLRPDGYEQALQIGNYCTGAPSRYGRP